MTAMPSLNGSLGYIFTSCDLDVKNSRIVRFKDMIERFKIYDQPHRPEERMEEWLAGERVDSRGTFSESGPSIDSGNIDKNILEYLLYGRFYLPTRRLDALYSTRISPTIQASVAAISDPRSNGSTERRSRGDNVSNVMLNLQHDTGKWCTEYSWSADDGMWGVRILHNFGKLEALPEASVEDNSQASGSLKGVDEEEATEGGLKGRLSAGAELYFSAKEKSAGGAVLMPLCFFCVHSIIPSNFQCLWGFVSPPFRTRHPLLSTPQRILRLLSLPRHPREGRLHSLHLLHHPPQLLLCSIP